MEGRVLLVDSDLNHLHSLSMALHYLGYHVVTCQTANEALSLLRQSSGEFDLLLTEPFLMDNQGFDFLTAVTAENNFLPVVMFSACRGRDVAIQALLQGACAFYPKPIAMENLKHLWQHVLRKKIHSCGGDRIVQVRASSPKLGTATRGEEAKRKRGMDGSKKPRFRWTPELHEKFLTAVKIVGDDKLFPRTILECMEKMGVQGLNRPTISSHLQQYQKDMKKKMKESAEDQNQSDNSGSSIDCVRDFVPITPDHHQVWSFSSPQGSSDQYSCGEEHQSQLLPPPSNGVGDSGNLKAYYSGSSSIDCVRDFVPITPNHHQVWNFSSPQGSSDQYNCGGEPQIQSQLPPPPPPPPPPSNGVGDSGNLDWVRQLLLLD